MTQARSMLDKLIYLLRGRRHAATLPADEYHDLVDLWQRRIVDVSAKGKNITEVYVDVQSHCDTRLKVVVPHGTYFKSSGQHQNMVVRRETVFDIEPRGARFLEMDAACINAARPIPGRRDRFRGCERVPGPLRAFLDAAEGRPAMVVQAGVWSLTDGYGRREIKDRLMSFVTSGHIASSISDADIDEAAQLLEQLGIQSPIAAPDTSAERM